MPEKETRVVVNGQPHSFAEVTNLAALIRELNLDPERVAVELNRSIVKRCLWNSTTVDAGAEIEIVQFVGGG